MMITVHFLENRTVVLTQLLQKPPIVNSDIKIKGRKGKIITVHEVEENVFQVYVEFEKLIKKQAAALDPKKKQR